MPTPNRPRPVRPTSTVRCRPRGWPRPKPPAAGWRRTGWCRIACCARRRDARARPWKRCWARSATSTSASSPSIYEATPGTLIALADTHNQFERLLLVGHNPAFEQLAALLHSGQSGDYRGMPPAGIAVLTIPVGAALEPGVAQLSAFWWP